MQIDQAIETSAGVVKFQGTVEGPELDMILQLGLNVLLANGAIKMMEQDKPEQLQ